MPAEYRPLLEAQLSSLHSRGFLTESEKRGALSLFTRFHDDPPKPLDWSKVRPIPLDGFLRMEDLPQPSGAELKTLLSKVAVLKLNGGLGTSMGCTGPKTAIPVKQGMSFLEIIVRQIHSLNQKHGVNIPLILMNSFNTDLPTKELLARVEASKELDIICFNQAHFPRLDAETLLPLSEELLSPSSPAYYYPPGHGDVLRASIAEGIVDTLAARGIEWIFLSNGDNLGAVLEPSILAKLCSPGFEFEFVSEQTPKSVRDVKGGVLINYENSVNLLEIAQVPSEHVAEFCGAQTFPAFNVNNIWISVAALKRVQDQGRSIDLSIIRNPKQVEVAGGAKHPVIQLETAVGSGIGFFKSTGLLVPRKRFVPVKKTCDLLIVESDVYRLADDYTLECTVPTDEIPTVEFAAGSPLEKLQFYEEAFKCVPSLKEAHHVTIAGEVVVGPGVSVRGDWVVGAGEVARPENCVVGK